MRGGLIRPWVQAADPDPPWPEIPPPEGRVQDILMLMMIKKGKELVLKSYLYLYVFFEYWCKASEEADEEAEGRHVAGAAEERGCAAG